MENSPQVFISYRGKDLRLTLVPHLIYHLKHNNVNVITDANIVGEKLRNLFKHIRNSRIVIVIFSINYLESKWCLEELSEIRKCCKKKKLDFVIPIFYKVRTFHVQKQTGAFGNPFPKTQEGQPRERIKRWKKALRFAAKRSGLSYKEDCSVSELDFIMEIVKKVNGLLGKIALKDSNKNYNIPKTSTEEVSNQILVDVTQLNELFHLSSTSETQNLEIFFVRGFMFGFTWKNLIEGGNNFEISSPANSLLFHMFKVQQGNDEALEKAINLLALHMMYEEHTEPSLVFSNWNKLDEYTKGCIIFSAQDKCQMLWFYNEGVGFKSFIPRNNVPVGTNNAVGTSTSELGMLPDRPHHEQTHLPWFKPILSVASWLCCSFKCCLCLGIDDQDNSPT